MKIINLQVTLLVQKGVGTRSHMAGVPKLSLAMYPFSIWIDEHVSLNMGAGSIFVQGETDNGFSRVGSKIFCRGEQKWQNYILTTRNLENNFFAKKVDGKISNFKILEGPCPLPQTPMFLKLLLTKKLRKISKIYLSISTCDALRTASHRDLSWRPFSSTPTSLTCQSPSPESMHMLTT